MSSERFHKQEIARRQLETAVVLFMAGADRSSVITLAGAASTIFDRLVTRAKRETFREYARRIASVRVGNIPKRSTYAHHIEERLAISANKHLSMDDPDPIELDLEANAIAALDLAIVEYRRLIGVDEAFFVPYVAWRLSIDPGLMERYQSLPDRLKPKK